MYVCLCARLRACAVGGVPCRVQVARSARIGALVSRSRRCFGASKRRAPVSERDAPFFVPASPSVMCGHVPVHPPVQGLQPAGGDRRQAPLLAAERPRRRAALLALPRRAAARRQPHTGLAQGAFPLTSRSSLLGARV